LNCTRTFWSTGLAAGRVSNAATVLKTSLFLIIGWSAGDPFFDV
jgi:hypothetical protein